MKRSVFLRLRSSWPAALSLALSGLARAGAPAAQDLPAATANHAGPACQVASDFFADEVWPKVAARTCLECHKPGGEADDSKFVLQDPTRDPDPTHRASLQHNRESFARMAALRKGDKSRLLLKATGGLSHGGEEALKPDSTGYRILAEYVRRQTEPLNASPAPLAVRSTASFFEGVAMLEKRRLLRRATLSLAGRLPKPEEFAALEKEGPPALRPILDAVMKEDAFYDRLAEAFNDILLIRGYADGAESALSYEHFGPTRFWPAKYDLSAITDPAARKKVEYKLSEDYRESLLREPLELIKYIVREERPFSEIVTADYTMVSPYTARGYGIFDEIRDDFLNQEDPFEYIPARLHSLRSRDSRAHQQSATGDYPHAGLLASFQYLRRYPTTETNRNRLRGRMFYQNFLGIDVLELAARVKDAAAVTAKFEIPTMQAAECVVCHRTLDPVAGLFQDYFSFEGVYGQRKGGWFKDMFAAGFEGEDMPADERWRSLAWLGERTANDPRFANTMVEHVYSILTGRKPLLAPKGLDDPMFDARQRAYQAQHAEVERIAALVLKKNFNLKEAFQAWVSSPFYGADGLSEPAVTPERRAELADLGVAHMLGPEQLERKINAVFGQPWGRLNRGAALLYGGIDAKEVTERAADPSGAMGAMQRTMADEVSCRNVALDFSRPPPQRRLFPEIEPDVLPGDPVADQRLRQAIVHLHELVLGRYDAADSPEVSRTFDLFAGILSDAQERKSPDKLENYFCRVAGEQRVLDPLYTVRAWRGVLTYLLRQRDFLYE